MKIKAILPIILHHSNDNLSLTSHYPQPKHIRHLIKWAVELSEFDIEYRARTNLKYQVFTDFIVELTLDLSQRNDEPEQPSTLIVDGASDVKGLSIGVYLNSPNNEVIEQPFRLGFKASNNEAEYEALIDGLQLAKALGVRRLNVQSDS